MKKITCYTCLGFSLAVLTSCAANRQKVNALAQDGNVIYANSWQLQGYSHVHQKPPIN